jgi:hypothetical protein
VRFLEANNIMFGYKISEGRRDGESPRQSTWVSCIEGEAPNIVCENGRNGERAGGEGKKGRGRGRERGRGRVRGGERASERGGVGVVVFFSCVMFK